MIDFYSLLARYWGVDRKEAKLRIASFYPHEYYLNPVSQLQPEVLSYIGTEARAEVLSAYGVVLGEN